MEIEINFRSITGNGYEDYPMGMKWDESTNRFSAHLSKELLGNLRSDNDDHDEMREMMKPVVKLRDQTPGTDDHYR